MSQPMYNPYASGNNRSNQGQYGLSSISAERDPRQASSHLGPGSILCSSGGSSGTSANTGQMVPSALPQTYRPETYRPETSGATLDDDIQRNVDMHISRAREEISLHTRNQDAHSSISQWDGVPSGVTSHVMSSASAGHARPPDVASTSSSLGWLSEVKRSIDDLSKPYSPVGSYASSTDAGFNFSSERERDIMSFSRLRDGDYSGSAKPMTHSEPGKPRYTSETATDILLRFGLEREDLEQLISYPEDQLTPANLPYILRQIRICKSKSNKPIASGAGRSEKDISKRSEAFLSTICQPSKVIDYGHTGKYTESFVEESLGSGSRPSGGVRLDTSISSSSSRETLSNKTGLVKPGDFGFPSDQMKSLPHPSSVAPPSHNPNKFSHTSVEHRTSLTQPRKDTDILPPRTLKSALKQLDTGSQKNLKAQPPPSALVRSVHPTRPGLVILGGNADGGTKEQTQTPQGSTAVVKHLKTQQKDKKTPQPPPKQLKKNSVPLMKLISQPSGKPVAGPSSLLDPHQPPAPILDSHKAHVVPRPSNRVVPLTKSLPSLSMINDYTASMPRIFPHTCVLCNKDCIDKKDWLVHQKSNVHFESCKLLRLKYPKWNGEITKVSRNAQPSQSVPQKTGKQSQQKVQYGSRSRSRSPLPHVRHDDSGRREKGSSQTHPPHGSTSTQSSRAPSRSYEKRSPPRNSSDRRAPRGRSCERDFSPARGHERHSPHRKSSDRWSPRGRSEDRYRSPSRSRDRRSPRGRSYDKYSSPRSSRERYSSPRSSRERYSSPRNSRERYSSPRNSRERYSPHRSSRERYSPHRSSRERYSLPQSSLSSAEQLAKKLLETTGAQTLSDPSKVEAVVKTLAPALLAELAKLKSSSSSSSKAEAGRKRSSASALSSSASTAKKKPSTVLPSKAKPSATSSSFKAVKATPPTMLRLNGIVSSLSHNDVTTAMSQYGKTKSVVLLRARKQAAICFQREEDAMKVKRMKSIIVGEVEIGVLSDGDQGGARAQISESSAKTNVRPRTPHAPCVPARRHKGPTFKPPRAKEATHLTHDKQPGTRENRQEELPEKSVTRTDSNPLPKPQTSKTTTSINEKAAPGSIKPGMKKKVPTKPFTSQKTRVKDRPTATKAKDLATKRKMTLKHMAKTSAGKMAAKPTVKTLGKPAVSTSIETKTQPSVDADQEKLQSLTSASVVEKDNPEVTDTTGSTLVSKEKGPTGAPEETVKHPTDILTEAENTSDPKQNECTGQTNPQKMTTEEGDAKGPTDNLAEARSALVLKQNECVGHESGASKPEKLTSKNPTGNLAEVQVATKAELGTPTKTPSVASTCIAEENTGRENTKSENPDLEEALVVEDVAQAVDCINGAEHQAEPDRADLDIKDSEPMETESVAEETLQPVPEKSPDACSESHTQPIAVDLDDVGPPTLSKQTAVSPQSNKTSVPPGTSSPDSKTPKSSEKSVEAPPQTPQPDSGTKVEASPVQQELAGSPAKAADEKMKTSSLQKVETASSGKTPKTGGSDSAVAKTDIKTKQSAKPPGAVSLFENLTKRSLLKNLPKLLKTFKEELNPGQIKKLIKKGKSILVAITNLPQYYEGCYTENDIIQLLRTFGFKCVNDNIFVIPQMRMAYVLISAQCTEDKVSFNKQSVMLGNCTLRMNFVSAQIKINHPGLFYETLMNCIGFPHKKFKCAERLIYVEKISMNQIQDLKKGLSKIGGDSYFLPLLNKVFIEFTSNMYADRFGVWYSLLNKPRGYEIHRMGIPYSVSAILHYPENVIPRDTEAIPGATIPTPSAFIANNRSPFWIILKNRPFVFPTHAPWFYTPDHLHLKRSEDVRKAFSLVSGFPTIMVTGLPDGNYKQEDVAALFWGHLSDQTLHSLYYNVTVLTMQRRAFIHFNDLSKCRQFIQNRLGRKLYVCSVSVAIHMVLQPITPAYSEELMFESLMKWSTTPVVDAESLEDRLLCVEIFETTGNIITSVVETVTSIAPIQRVLALANRICIEMVDAQGVAQVVEKYRPQMLRPDVRDNIGHLESVKTFKQRRKDSFDSVVDLQRGASEVHWQAVITPRETVDQAGSTTSPSVGVEPTAVLPGAEDPASESPSDVTSNQKTGEDAATVKGKEKQASPSRVCAASSCDLPNMTEGAVATAVQQQQLDQKPAPDEVKKEAEDVESADLAHADSFAEKDFNIEDFVTLDEISDDVDPRRWNESSSSSAKLSTMEKGENKGSHVVPCSLNSGPTSNSASVSSINSKDSPQDGTESSSSAPVSQASASDHGPKTATTPEGTVSKSDHKVSTEATKSPEMESDTKIQCTVLFQQTKEDCKSETDQTMDDVKHDGSSENQQTKPLESQTVDTELHQVLHSVEDDCEKMPAGDTEIKTEGSFQVLNSVTEEPTTEPEHGHLVKDDKPEMNRLAQENTTAIETPDEKYTTLNTVLKHVEMRECTDETSEASQDVKTTNVQIPAEAEPFDGREKEGHDGAGIVLDSVEDSTATIDDKQDFCEESVQVLDAVVEDKVVTESEETHQAKDDNSTLKELSQERANAGIDAPENPEGNSQVKTESSEEASKDTKSSDTEIPSEEQTFEESGKGTPDSSTDGPDTFKVLNSICDPDEEHNEDVTPLLTNNQTASADNILEDDACPVEVPEDEYQIIDSVEEEPMTAELEMEKDKRTKKESTRKEDRPERSGSSTRGTRKSEDMGNSPNIHDGRVKYETRAKKDHHIPGTSEKHKDSANSTEETVEFQIVDSVEDESLQDAATTGRSSRRGSRRKVVQKTALVVTEATRKQEGAEPVYKILDSVEDEAADEPLPSVRSTRKKSEKTTPKETSSEKEVTPTTKRRTTRASQERRQETSPKKEEVAEESTSSKKSNVTGKGKASTRTSDSGQDKPTKDDQVLTTRSMRSRKETAAKREAANEKTSPKEDISSKRRRTLRESQQTIRDGTPQKEDKVSSRKETTETSPSAEGRKKLHEEEDVSYQILDSLEEEVVKDDPPATRGKQQKQKARPKKAATRESTRLRHRDEASEDMSEATYQILDSVEDDDLSATEEADASMLGKASGKNDEKTTFSESLSRSPNSKEEEEEPLYQIVDSVEDEDVNAKGELTEDPDGGRNQRGEQDEEEAPPAKSDPPVCPEGLRQQETLCHVVDSLEKEQPGEEVIPGKKAAKTEDKAAKTFPADDTPTPDGGKVPKPREKNQQRVRSTTAAGATSALNLEEVSEQEEDFSDSAFEEEEEPGKREATARKKRFVQRKGRKRRSHGSGGDAASKRLRERDEEMDTKELLTLDEVGADEPEEENAPKAEEGDGEVPEGKRGENLRKEETKAEQSAPEPLPPIHEHESVSPMNSEVLLTVDETNNGKKEEEAEKPPIVEQHSDVPDEMSNFVTVDELVSLEEEEDEEQEEVTAKTSGRANKRSRQTPATVRKSTRGSKGCTKEEESGGTDAPPPAVSPASGGDKPALSDGQKTGAKVEVRNEKKLPDSSGGEEPKDTDQKPREEKKEKEKEEAAEVPSKELVEPEAKRPRAESPSVSLPPFKPDNPLGQEFVIPKTGFFCSLCSIFFTSESAAKQRHCGTRKHYDSLQKRHQNLQSKRSSKQLSDQASSSN